MKILVYIIVLTLVLCNVSAEPAIIFRNGVNITEAQEIVNQIPEKYLEDIDVIEFSNKISQEVYGYFYAACKTNKDGEITSILKQSILIYNDNRHDKTHTLWHEIGHSIELKNFTRGDQTLSEQFAKDFSKRMMENTI